MPGIMKWPAWIPSGQVSADPANTMDLLPTIAGMSGAQIPEDRVIDGKNLLRFLEGEAPSPSQLFFYERGHSCEAVRRGRWKYRLTRNARTDIRPDQPLEPELFDLDVDPGENHNLAAEKPEIVAELDAMLGIGN